MSTTLVAEFQHDRPRSMRIAKSNIAAIFIVTTSMLLSGPVAQALQITAYLHEFEVSGTFGAALNNQWSGAPIYGNAPDSTYPFPEMKGGTFRGRFVYDSMASLHPTWVRRFPYESVIVELFDNSGLLVNTITTGPNHFYISADGQLLQLAFGPSFGVLNAIEDLRLFFNGSFTLDRPPPPPELPAGCGNLTVGIAPPLSSEVAGGAFAYGILATDSSLWGPSWVLPVSSANIVHIGTTPYRREVPEAGSTAAMIVTAIGSLLWLRRRYRTEGAFSSDES